MRDGATASTGQHQVEIHPKPLAGENLTAPNPPRPLQLPSVLGDPFSPLHPVLYCNPQPHTHSALGCGYSQPHFTNKGNRLREVKGLTTSKW